MLTRRQEGPTTQATPGTPLGAQTQGQQAETGTPLKCVIGGSRGLPGLFICHEKVKVKGKVKSESWLPSKLQMWGLEWWGWGEQADPSASDPESENEIKFHLLSCPVSQSLGELMGAGGGRKRSQTPLLLGLCYHRLALQPQERLGTATPLWVGSSLGSLLITARQQLQDMRTQRNQN